MISRLTIGIDPDIEKSGVAVAVDGKITGLRCMRFPEIVEYFRVNKDCLDLIVIEAGWLNRKSNFHPAWGPARREKIARDIGRNHATGQLLVEMAESLGIKVELYRPVSSKVNHDTFCQIVGWHGGRTNQEKRDAGMALFYAGKLK